MQGAILSRSVAEPDIGSGNAGREAREVITGCRRREIRDDILVAQGRACSPRGALDSVVVVDHRRDQSMEGISGFDSIGARDTVGHPPNLGLETGARRMRIGARCSTDADDVGNDVQRLEITRGHRAGADDGGVDRIGSAGYDRLQGGKELASGHDRIASEMGLAPMRADAPEGDFPPVRRCELRTGYGRDAPDGNARHVVKTVEAVDPASLEQSVSNHRIGAAPAFLGGLEYEMDGPRQIASSAQRPGRPEEHGSMAVVTAGMHPSVDRRPIGTVSGLWHRQRVHVGAQGDVRALALAPQRSDDSGSAEAGNHLEAAIGKKAGDDPGGPRFLEAQLWMCMQVTPDRDEGGQIDMGWETVGHVWTRAGTGGKTLSGPGPNIGNGRGRMSSEINEIGLSTLRPHDYWQELRTEGGFGVDRAGPFTQLYPARLPGGGEIALPIRVLPSGDRAVASLIVNQASFAVADALAQVMADAARPYAPEMIVGVPTLGLPLAENVARRLGHPRMVALGTSRKFWYDETLSEPLRSITSPGGGKRIYLDPRMLPLLRDRSFILVDDVISTGSSILAVLTMLARAGLGPAAVLVAMLQGDTWRGALSSSPFADVPVLSALTTPLLASDGKGAWNPL